MLPTASATAIAATALTLFTGCSAAVTTVFVRPPATAACDEDAITQGVAALSYIRSTTSAVSSAGGHSSTTVEASASDGPFPTDEHI
jgi:uncharacterized lipoprotein YajG